VSTVVNLHDFRKSFRIFWLTEPVLASQVEIRRIDINIIKQVGRPPLINFSRIGLNEQNY
jgi:hypothetical protein